jgi:hypothetical protein
MPGPIPRHSAPLAAAFDAQTICRRPSYASFWDDHANLQSLEFAGLVSSPAQIRQRALQLMQHILQFP